MVESFHDNTFGTVQYDGSSSDPFPIKSGVKQGCVLTPTLFGIFFSLLLRYAFSESGDGIFLHTRCDGNLFNLARLRAKTKVHRIQRRLRWLGHVCRMNDRRIPKDILYGELITGTRPTGRPALRYKYVCKRDLKSCSINPAVLESATSNRSSWRANVKIGVKLAEEKREAQCEERKSRKQQKTQSPTAYAIVPTADYICSSVQSPLIGPSQWVSPSPCVYCTCCPPSLVTPTVLSGGAQYLQPYSYPSFPGVMIPQMPMNYAQTAYAYPYSLPQWCGDQRTRFMNQNFVDCGVQTLLTLL
ncbi:hypothetical protein PDJAM_G00180330 [Pangasius djambal]|uniref:Uncharacterized protein n=1 Tax=Pangasius djambal TaxID=1691987 RepID=A0ACC5ZQH3_9TELE|nr:hypothetical protein [Pangasius djambal]